MIFDTNRGAHFPARRARTAADASSLCRGARIAMIVLILASSAWSQQEPPATEQAASATPGATYTPPSASQRVDWWAEQSFAPRSLAVGAFTSGFWTWLNQPPEWGSGPSGFGRRYATRQAEVTISSASEASLGAVWGEDPRYFPSGKPSFWGRVGWAVSSAFLAHGPEGTRRPAVARSAAFLGARAVTNTWRPESERTWWNYSLVPLGTGFGSRVAANLFVEFAADIF